MRDTGNADPLRWMRLAGILMPWIALAGIFISGLGKYAQVIELVPKIARMDERTSALETRAAVGEAKGEEWQRGMTSRLERMERKIDKLLP